MIPVRGYAALDANTPLSPFNFERREPGANDILIDIAYCGICHSDIHQVKGEWGNSLYPMVPGHEIVGHVNQVGSEVTQFKSGDIVGVGCMVDSCKQCQECVDSQEQFCAEGATWTYNATERGSDTLTQGGYSTQIVVDQDFVLKVPDNLALDATAPLLCAGITLYSPLKHWQAGPGKNVAILGLGGLGHMGVKLGSAMGANLSVLSHSPSKKDEALRLGADNFYNTREPQTFEQLAGHFDLIICTVSNKIDWNQYLNLLKRDGTMVLLGIPEEEVGVSAMPLVFGRRRLAGSLIGGIKETQEMLDFCGNHNITADIELISIDKVNQAYERVLNSDVRYRFVIDINSYKNS